LTRAGKYQGNTVCNGVLAMSRMNEMVYWGALLSEGSSNYLLHCVCIAHLTINAACKVAAIVPLSNTTLHCPFAIVQHS